MLRKLVALLVVAALILSGCALLARGGQRNSEIAVGDAAGAPSEPAASLSAAPAAPSEKTASETAGVSEAAPQVGTLDSDPVSVAWIFFGYGWTAKQEEFVQEAVSLATPQTSKIDALMIPLLPGAADVRLDRYDGPKAKVEDGFAIVSVQRIDRKPQLVSLVYTVPNHFATGEAYEFVTPAFLWYGVRVGLAQEYGDEIVVVGDGFERDKSLDAHFKGYHVWSSQKSLPKGTKLKWTIRPADPGSYKHTTPLPAPPKSCVSPDGKPLCGKGGK